MKKIIFSFHIVVFAFFVINTGTSQSSRAPVSTIDFGSDGRGFIQYRTNDSQKYGTSWWQFVDNTLGGIIDNVYEIECKKTSGASDYGYGMVFGASNAEPNKHYFILISAEGRYIVRKNNNDKKTTIKDWGISERLNTGYNATNTIKVVKNGSAFTIFFNGSQVYQFKDSTIKGDRLGYIVDVGDEGDESFPGTPVDVRFRQTINTEVLGRQYIEKKAGFTMFMPKDWGTLDAKQEYLVAMGPSENNFSPNIIFVDEKYSGPISVYIDGAIEQLSQTFDDFRVIEKGAFETLQGIQGGYFLSQGKLNETNVRQKFYVVPNKKGNMVMNVACTISLASGNKYDLIFNECAKTFVWTK